MNLTCPYCGENVWTRDEGANCSGCGADWDACGNLLWSPIAPMSGDFEQSVEVTE